MSLLLGISHPSSTKKEKKKKEQILLMVSNHETLQPIFRFIHSDSASTTTDLDYHIHVCGH
jgi:hypothetical protein